MTKYFNVSITIICVVLGIMISLQYRSINFDKDKIERENKSRSELQDELIRQANNNENLRKRLNELMTRNDKLENIKGGKDEVVESLQQDLEEAKIIAGLATVKGKGLIVRLTDGEEGSVCDENILGVVNELKAAGAQAISINDERLIAMSEIRSAGNNIVINGVPMKEPFIIKAIAESSKLENALKMIGGQVEYLEFYGINVSIEKSDSIIIDKVRDDGTVIKTDMLEFSE